MKKKEIVFLYTEPEAEPSEWLKGISYNYLSRFNIPAELQGKYTLCVGLTDKTKNNEAAIDLAVSGNFKNREMDICGWTGVVMCVLGIFAPINKEASDWLSKNKDFLYICTQ